MDAAPPDPPLSYHAVHHTPNWVAWSNDNRLHSSIANVPPAEYEAAHYATHLAEQATAPTPEAVP